MFKPVTFAIDNLAKHFKVPELRVNPPKPKPNPQVTRPDYRYQTPQERADVADELMITLQEAWHSIDFLERSVPEAGENFPMAKLVLSALINKVREHKAEKIDPWLTEDTNET